MLANMGFSGQRLRNFILTRFFRTLWHSGGRRFDPDQLHSPNPLAESNFHYLPTVGSAARKSLICGKVPTNTGAPHVPVSFRPLVPPPFLRPGPGPTGRCCYRQDQGDPAGQSRLIRRRSGPISQATARPFSVQSGPRRETRTRPSNSFARNGRGNRRGPNQSASRNSSATE